MSFFKTGVLATFFITLMVPLHFANAALPSYENFELLSINAAKKTLDLFSRDGDKEVCTVLSFADIGKNFHFHNRRKKS